MTRDQFIEETQADMDDLTSRGYDVVPCVCDDPCCPQWQIAQVPDEDEHRAMTLLDRAFGSDWRI